MTLISGGSMQPVAISTDPPDAVAVTTGGACRAPGVLVLDRADDYDVTVTRDGYAPAHARIESHWSPLKIVGSVLLNATHGFFTMGITFVIGMAADVASGSLKDLEPRTVFVPLMRWETKPIAGGPDGSGGDGG